MTALEVYYNAHLIMKALDEMLDEKFPEASLYLNSIEGIEEVAKRARDLNTNEELNEVTKEWEDMNKEDTK